LAGVLFALLMGTVLILIRVKLPEGAEKSTEWLDSAGGGLLTATALMPAKRRAVDMLTTTLSMSERLACKAVGLARSTYRRLPQAQTPADPDAEIRAWLRSYATKHPCHGFRRAWAALRYDERREVNKKKIHRLWREEGLQVRVHSPRKRAGVCSPPVAANARTWCGRSTSSSTPPSTARRSRSRR
jgi:hypothetical protein